MEVTGLADETVVQYLRDEFKQVPHGGSKEPKVSAVDRVENVLGKKVAQFFPNLT